MARRGSRPALRLVALLAAFTLVFAAVAARLVQLQVVRAQPLEQRGAEQRVRSFQIPARRGALFDRTMMPLAVSTEARDIWANPRFVDDPAAAAALLAPLLRRDAAGLRELLTRDAGFVYLARKVSPAVADRVLALDLPFLGALRATERTYPADRVAGQVLGFVGTDGEGLSGLEVQYEQLLRGTPGEEIVEQDPTGRPIPQGRHSIRQPVPGKGLVLTIDRELQFFAEAALARGVRTTTARSGTAIVMDPASGEVLAMANYPPLDPNRFAAAPDQQRRNRAVTDSYEPGSINKVVTAAAALESGLLAPSTLMQVPDRIHVAGRTFRDFEPHPTQRITYAEALARSSNVGTIKVALQVGAPRLHRMLTAFGLGHPTGVGYPGEASGILLPLQDWYVTSIGTVPIGQGIAVTPLQIASVYATIANGGVRVQPRLVSGVVERDGSLIPMPDVRRTRVVSTYTAARLRGMLVGVVEQGTGARAALPGYLVAGKTGTARVPFRNRPGYSRDIVTSFVGFAPADAPRLVVFVSLDNPRPRMSALTAAPVFREITAYALGKLGVVPTVARPDDGSLLQRRAPLPPPSSPAPPDVTPVRSAGEQETAP